MIALARKLAMKLRQHGPTRGGGFFSRVGVVPMVEANEMTGHEFIFRTSIPAGTWRPYNIDQPDEPVSEVQGTVDANLYGPTRTNASGSLPCVSAVRLPSKDAGVWIVLQNLANAFGRKVSSCFDGHVADYPISTPVPPIHAMIGVQYDGNR